MSQLYWSEIKHGHRSHHLDLVDERLKNFKDTDVVVHIGERSFDCHLLLLQCYSQVFDEMGNIPEVTLPLERVTPEVFELIYQWLLSSSPRLQREHFAGVFVAAEYLRIPALMKQCWACVDDPNALVEKAAFVLYTEARVFQHTILQNMMLGRISVYFIPLVASEEWSRLPFEDITTLLKSNYIGVFAEADVLYSVCLWLLEDWDFRSDRVGELINLVRFPLMSSRFLSRLINCDEDQRIHCILEHSTTRKLAIQALTDLCMASNELGIINNNVKRYWLHDPGAGQQKDEISGYPPQRQERSFVQFLELLQRLKENPECWVDWHGSQLSHFQNN